jgi:hypothetical protein
MSRVDCHLLDERLMDYLYEELETREMDEFRAHVEGCPRCSAEIGRFRGVRKAVAQLAMVEPPAAVSAKLMHQAAQSHKQSMWRRSRAMRATVYAAPIVAMAAAFVLLFHVKDKAMSPTIHADDVSVTIDGRKAAESPAPAVAAEPPATIEIPPAKHDVTLAAKPADDLAKEEESGERLKAKPKSGLVERKAEFKPPVTKDLKLGKATVAHGAATRGAGAPGAAPAPPPARAAAGDAPRGQTAAGSKFGQGPMHVAPSSGGEDFDSVTGGAISGRRDNAGAAKGKAGGDVGWQDKSQAAEKPAAPRPEPQRQYSPPPAKPREVAKTAKKEAPPQNYYQQQPASPPPPPQASSRPTPTTTPPGATPQLTTSPQGGQVNVQNEGYIGRYRNAPAQQAPAQPAPKVSKAPVANAESPEMDETRTSTESLARDTRREQQKQAAPDQVYAQLVTATNNGNDCGKVMDLVKQLESWNYWGDQHPSEMRNAYLLRGRCQNDNNLAKKDYENANRIAQEQEKTANKRAGNKKASKSKAVDNNATQAAPAEAAPSKK